ncbi:hypothetical protein GR268_46215, partial [Rhizobium leguminosarum]|nr:hypothetical protein [Rhizobium leguminosarum]
MLTILSFLLSFGTAIKNKLAYILVLIFKQDYLAQWPTFFSELFGLLQLVHHCMGSPYCSSQAVLTPTCSGTCGDRHVPTNHQDHRRRGRERGSAAVGRRAHAQHCDRTTLSFLWSWHQETGLVTYP